MAVVPFRRQTVSRASLTTEERLAKLAVEIKQCITTSTEAAIDAGRKLIEAKEQVLHGRWGAWLRDQLDISERTAQVRPKSAARCVIHPRQSPGMVLPQEEP